MDVDNPVFLFPFSVKAKTTAATNDGERRRRRPRRRSKTGKGRGKGIQGMGKIKEGRCGVDGKGRRRGVNEPKPVTGGYRHWGSENPGGGVPGLCQRTAASKKQGLQGETGARVETQWRKKLVRQKR